MKIILSFNLLFIFFLRLNEPCSIEIIDKIREYKINSNEYNFKLTIERDNFKIELNEIRKNDSIYYTYTNCFNQIPISNKIVFYKNNKVIRVTSIPYNKVKAKNYLFKEIKFLDNKISDMSLVKCKKNYFICIEGSGGCNSCNESISFYTLNGDLAYFWYGNKNHIVKKFINKKLISSVEVDFAEIVEKAK